MSETVMKLLAEELKALRITCPNAECRAITEVSLVKLPGNFSDHICPVCNQAFIPAGADRNAGHIRKLAGAIQALVALKDKVTIEFVVQEQVK